MPTGLGSCGASCSTAWAVGIGEPGALACRAQSSGGAPPSGGGVSPSAEGERHAAPARARARRPLHATLAATLVRVRAATNAVSALLPPAQSKYARAGGASLALAGPAGPSQRGGNPTALDLNPLGSRRRRHRQCDTPPSSRELAARESVWFRSPC